MSTSRGDRRQTEHMAVELVRPCLDEPQLAFSDALVAVFDRRRERYTKADVVTAKEWLERPVPMQAP